MDGNRRQPQTGGQPEPDTRRPRPWQRLESHAWRRIASGFLVLIPLIVTFLIIRFIFIFVDGFFRGERGIIRPWIEGTPLDFPGFGVAIVLVILYVIGVLVTARAGRKALDWQGVVLSRIPVVKNIYGVAKQATDNFSGPGGHGFSRVVFIQWPRKGVKALGFVTGRCYSPDVEGGELLVVYIPTVPNPTSGNLAFVAEEEIIETDISVEDAMKLVFSGGIVLPDNLQIDTTDELRELPRA